MCGVLALHYALHLSVSCPCSGEGRRPPFLYLLPSAWLLSSCPSSSSSSSSESSSSTIPAKKFRDAFRGCRGAGCQVFPARTSRSSPRSKAAAQELLIIVALAEVAEVAEVAEAEAEAGRWAKAPPRSRLRAAATSTRRGRA